MEDNRIKQLQMHQDHYHLHLDQQDLIQEGHLLDNLENLTYNITPPDRGVFYFVGIYEYEIYYYGE